MMMQPGNGMMRVVIVTDAWEPQINGVVRTLRETIVRLRSRGHDVRLITPDMFRTLPCPGYDEIRLALVPRFRVRRYLDDVRPDIVHIATEGPIGWSARGWCMDRNVPFTTAFHTRFPDYAAVRTGLSPKYFWPIMRRFHKPSRAVMVSTPALQVELATRGIGRTRLWSRGIDADLFRPGRIVPQWIQKLPRPVMLSVGRVSVEKNLCAFLDADLPGTKLVVGDGPALPSLRAQYPDAVFAGHRDGDDLADVYAAADIFVFSSRTDTFGLVMIEALACGTPVAGYPVAGPLDIVGADGLGGDGRLQQPVGVLDEDLAVAIRQALTCNRAMAARYGASYSWDRSTDQFETALIEALDTPVTLSV